MASENRQLPNTNRTRMIALDAATAKNTATSGTILSALTQTRLAAINASYRTKFDAIAPLKHDLGVLTAQKLGFYNALFMKSSHFIQILNFEIAEGNLTEADRDWYKLTASGGDLPDMSTEAELDQVAKDLIKGEADRIAAGGTALIYPIARVQTAFNNFDGILMPHSTAADALDTAQEALQGLNDEADKVIKKVWSEVETYYNEETPESQRANAREWGVVYVLRGSKKHVDGHVYDIVTNLPVAGATVHFKNGNATAVTDADGFFELNTTLMGVQKLQVEENIHLDFEMDVTLVENENVEELVIKITPA